MDIRAYISSGIIESYLLGLAIEAEIQELESYAAIYPEVSEAIEDQRLALESYTSTLQATPPANLKEQIWNALKTDDPTLEPVHNSTKDDTLPVTASRWLVTSWWAAACVVLLIASVATNIVLWRQQQATVEAIAALKRSQQQEISAKENTLLAYQQYVQLTSDTNIIAITMKGVGEHTDNTAAIFWNKATREVFLSHNNLPQAPAGKQYQLWAIVDGKPVDAGVFDAGQQTLLIPMKAMERAEMFAVTLEPTGGSIAPTLDQMYVAGKI